MRTLPLANFHSCKHREYNVFLIFVTRNSYSHNQRKDASNISKKLCKCRFCTILHSRKMQLQILQMQKMQKLFCINAKTHKNTQKHAHAQQSRKQAKISEKSAEKRGKRDDSQRSK